MCDVGGKHSSGIKSMYADSLACVRVKVGNSEQFRIDSGVKRGVSCPIGFSTYIWIQ